MRLHFFPLALLLPTSLLACFGSSGPGPDPGATCAAIDILHQLKYAAPMSPGSVDTLLCLGREPSVSATAEAECVAFHGSKATGGACSCPADQGLQDVSAAHKDAAAEFLNRATDTSGVAGCVCEIKQLTKDDGDRYSACSGVATSPVVDVGGHPVNGYCYVGPPGSHSSDAFAGNPALLKSCTSTQLSALRFVGRPATQEATDLRVEVTCTSLPCDRLE